MKVDLQLISYLFSIDFLKAVTDPLMRMYLKMCSGLPKIVFVKNTDLRRLTEGNTEDAFGIPDILFQQQPQQQRSGRPTGGHRTVRRGRIENRD